MNFQILPQNADKENSLIPIRKNSKSDLPQDHCSPFSSQHQRLVDVQPACPESQLYKIKCQNQRKRANNEKFNISLSAII